MKTGQLVLPALVLAWAISTTLNAGTIGLTVPGSGVVIGPVTNICAAAVNCPASAYDFQAGYSAPAQASFNGSWTGTGASENLTGTGYASIGFLQDSSSVSVTSGDSPITAIYGDAASFVEDTLTISDPSLTGTAGSLVLGLSIDGTGSDPTYNATSGIGTNAGFDVFAGAAQEGLPPATYYGITDGSISTSYFGPAVPFTYGQPVSIELYSESVVGAYCLMDCSPWTGLPVSAMADPSATLDSLTVYSDGNVVPAADWSVTSASGATYTADGVVPEPSYSLLLVVMALTLGAVRQAAIAKEKKSLLPIQLR